MPLYRRVIAGAAIELGSEYGGRTRQDPSRVDGDETEDLFELLSTVKVLAFLCSVCESDRMRIHPGSPPRHRGSGHRRDPLELSARAHGARVRRARSGKIPES